LKLQGHLNIKPEDVYLHNVAKDAPLPWQLSFQDPATPSMEGVIDLHHEIMFYIVVIIIFVLWMLVRIIMLFNSKDLALPYSNITHHVELEWA
jgi:cytochrome c oxidase subunit 2